MRDRPGWQLPILTWPVLGGNVKKGNKGDQVDADQLSEQLRRGGLRSAYHGCAERSRLKGNAAMANRMESHVRL
jgi:hypothetical protein